MDVDKGIMVDEVGEGRAIMRRSRIIRIRWNWNRKKLEYLHPAETLLITMVTRVISNQGRLYNYIIH